MLYSVTDAIGTAMVPKPTLEEMRDWADDQETRGRRGLFRAALANGFVPDGCARPLAAARRLVEFLDGCIENREAIETVFRAKAHMRRRDSQ